ncbi:MAG: DUF3800 domain-containing protein [Anaerolineae bacterium]|nr:DUF3800 domain-containing protein [Anaerolineae bacterium]
MYLMYVDESGDCGLTNSPTRYFVLTGLILNCVGSRILINSLICVDERGWLAGDSCISQINARSLLLHSGLLAPSCFINAGSPYPKGGQYYLTDWS